MAGCGVYFKKSHEDLPKDGLWVWKEEESRTTASLWAVGGTISGDEEQWGCGEESRVGISEKLV